MWHEQYAASLASAVQSSEFKFQKTGRKEGRKRGKGERKREREMKERKRKKEVRCSGSHLYS